MNKSITDLFSNIQNTIKRLTEEKKANNIQSNKAGQNKKIEIAEQLSTIDTSNIQKKEYDNLLILLKDLDFELTKDISEIFNLLDELFIERPANTKLEYYKILNDLKDEINNLEI